jgi:hypothetical protein
VEKSDERISTILKQSRVIAIVGLSPDTTKASNVVANYLRKAGYRIIPVNPSHREILGEPSYPSLLHIPEKVDIVDVFMRAEKVLPVVEEAIVLKPRCIWLQLGIISGEAEALARSHGIPFFMDLCLKIEHSRLVGPPW